MAEYIIDGIKCISEVFNLRTGETKPYDKNMQHDIVRSYVSQLSVEEIEALPGSSIVGNPNFDVFISQDKVCVKEHTNKAKQSA